jgi:hypothetical protein
MKRIWRIKNKLGVSAVAGTAAAAGITMVLAAMLFGGVGDVGDHIEISPFGAFTKVKATGDNTVRMDFGTFAPTPMFVDCKLVISPPSGDRLLSWNFTRADGKIVAIDNGANDGFTLHVTDLGGEGKVSMGDFVTLKADEDMEQGEWAVNMVYAPTGGSMAMKTFTR